jgi:tripartite-type tricarboxylate transporter receptor subunit TctC
MPTEVAERIARVAAEGLRSPAVQEVFRSQAAIPVTSTPAEMRAFVAADRERWAVLVRELNIRLE